MAFFKKEGFDRKRSRSSDRDRGFDRGKARGFKPFERDSGVRGFERDRPRGGNPALELFDATCDKCGAECELPFKPRGGKPVYCRDCFRNTGGSDSRDRPSRSNLPSSMSSEQLEEINRKLDKILSMLNVE
jgi:CxxC-x17-CxxC domain-containing protein